MSKQGKQGSSRLQPIQLIVYQDTPHAEGQEAKQLLACFPSSIPVDDQLTAVGLVQAICQFSSTFSKVSVSATQANAARKRHRLLLTTDVSAGPTCPDCHHTGQILLAAAGAPPPMAAPGMRRLCHAVLMACTV